jgi:ribose transport system permease protein
VASGRQSAIAAVVIGGTSLMGGRGSVLRTFLGVLIIATLQTGLAHVGASEPAKRMITGAVIVLAVIADVHRGSWVKMSSRVLQRVRPRALWLILAGGLAGCFRMLM